MLLLMSTDLIYWIERRFLIYLKQKSVLITNIFNN